MAGMSGCMDCNTCGRCWNGAGMVGICAGIGGIESRTCGALHSADARGAECWYARLQEHHKLANHILASVNKQFHSLHQELTPTQAESSHEPLSCDIQSQEDSKKHPVAYYSTTLNEVQWNYNIYEIELLAITECLKHWRPDIARPPHETKVHTDHANLTYWRQLQKISRHIARQVLKLEEYNIKLQHVSGKNNGHADALLQ